MNGTRVEVRRGGWVESVHRVVVAVADGSQQLRALSGHANLITFARSAVKPIQAIPLVEDGVVEHFRISDRELALCCASHNGEPRHVETAAGLLKRLGLDENSLACGPHEPMYAPAARVLRDAGQRPGRLHNNCSGKHAGMLALAAAHGWSVADYHRRDHPVQQRMLQEMTRWSGVESEDILIAVDGCGVVTFGLPISSLALAFGKLASAARKSENGAARVVNAMLKWPEFIAGKGRLCTRLAQVSAGRIFAKVGAEGVYCAGIPGAELGVALKVEDGASRAAGPALVAVLHTLGLLSDDEVGQLSEFAEPELKNTRAERVGEMRAFVELEPQ